MGPRRPRPTGRGGWVDREGDVRPDRQDGGGRLPRPPDRRPGKASGEQGNMNIQKMMKEAQRMQEEMERKLAEMRVEGTAGGGLVKAVMDGQKNLLSIT